jgi:hypothetical protein
MLSLNQNLKNFVEHIIWKIFYQKHHLNPKDTIKLIINKDHTFLAKHLPIKKYLQKDVSKFIDTVENGILKA